MNSSPTDLMLDWCSYEAAKFACKHWHYSGSLSSSKNLYIGVWEKGRFIGCVIFGIGAGNVTNGERFGLPRNCTMAELTRVALALHESSVSRIVAIAVKLLKRQSPGLRLLISMADPAQGHHGGIYQAAGWTYTGTTKADVEYLVDGKWVHHRTATNRGSAAGLPSRKIPAKHRYLLPLDEEMKSKILPLKLPYPKRVASETGDTPEVHSGKGGSTPTATLHDQKAVT